jgi:hypothetical protein
MDINLLSKVETRNEYMRQLETICTQNTISNIFGLNKHYVNQVIRKRKYKTNKNRIYHIVKCARCGKDVRKRSDNHSAYCISCGRSRAWDGRRLSDSIKRECVKCGKEITLKRKSWLNGTKMCPVCRSSHAKLKYGEATFNAIYNRYKGGAKKKGLEFKITKNKFKIIAKEKCFYCGKTPSNTKASLYNNGDFIYNGIDRIDSSKGYVMGNIVSCCKDCNYAKNILSQKDFYKLIENIYNNLKNKGVFDEPPKN